MSESRVAPLQRTDAHLWMQRGRNTTGKGGKEGVIARSLWNLLFNSWQFFKETKHTKLGSSADSRKNSNWTRGSIHPMVAQFCSNARQLGAWGRSQLWSLRIWRRGCTVDSGSQKGVVLPLREHWSMSGDTSGRQNWGQVLLARGCGGWEAAQHPPAHRTSPGRVSQP